MKILPIILLLLLPNLGFALIGGKNSEESLITKKLVSYVFNYRGCGYTRISERYFITAAHCTLFEGDTRVVGEITYGEKNKKAILGFNRIPFIDWMVFSRLSYEDQKERPSDLALVSIDQGDLGKIQEIKIAKINSLKIPRTGDVVYLSGYGCYHDSPGERLVDGGFRTGAGKIADQDRSYLYSSGIESENVVLCPGDSGSALFNTDFEVIGINSARQTRYPERASMFTRIDFDAKTYHKTLSSQMEPYEWLSMILGETGTKFVLKD